MLRQEGRADGEVAVDRKVKAAVREGVQVVAVVVVAVARCLVVADAPKLHLYLLRLEALDGERDNSSSRMSLTPAIGPGIRTMSVSKHVDVCVKHPEVGWTH